MYHQKSLQQSSKNDAKCSKIYHNTKPKNITTTHQTKLSKIKPKWLLESARFSWKLTQSDPEPKRPPKRHQEHPSDPQVYLLLQQISLLNQKINFYSHKSTFCSSNLIF